MSPASYLTAPPRVAVAKFITGLALVGVRDELGAAFELHPEMARREPARLERLGVPTLGGPANLHQQHPRRRRVAPEQLARLLLGDLTRCHTETLANNQYLTSADRIR